MIGRCLRATGFDIFARCDSIPLQFLSRGAGVLDSDIDFRYRGRRRGLLISAARYAVVGLGFPFALFPAKNPS